MNTFVLSIDLGTSGPKAALVSCDGKVAGAKRTFVHTEHVGDRGMEQDPFSVWSAVKLAIRKLLAEAKLPAKEIAALICSSQYSSIVPVDRSGEPLANMLLWTDSRGTKEQLSKIARLPWGIDSPWRIANWLRLHGLAPIAPGLSIHHMRYFRFMQPEVYEKTFKFLEPMDFLGMKFTGRAATTQSNTLMSLLVDNRTLNATGYHPTLLKYSYIDRDKLPDVVGSDTILGTVAPHVAQELGLSPKTQVVVGLNDTAAGALGSLAFSGSHAALGVGTSAVMVTHTQAKRTSIRDSLFTMPGPDQRSYLAVAENGVAGLSLERFLQHIAAPQDAFASCAANLDLYEALERAQATVPAGAGGVLYLPWISGSCAPRTDHRMRGAFVNINAETTRCHMARAVLEGLALNLRWVRRPLERFVRREFTHFNFYGGAGHSKPMAQILADVLATPVQQMCNPQFVNSIGAAMLAFERIGKLSFADFSQQLKITAVYEPRLKYRALYDEKFEVFVDAFKALQAFYSVIEREKLRSVK